MALMVGSLYDAVKDAGANDDKARKAAEEVAAYEGRIARNDADLTLLKWMVGTNIALTVAILWRVFAGG
jgi:hypothetical protein